MAPLLQDRQHLRESLRIAFQHLQAIADYKERGSQIMKNVRNHAVAFCLQFLDLPRSLLHHLL